MVKIEKIIRYRSIYIRLLLVVFIAMSLLYFFSVQINILASRDIKEKSIETAISKLDYYVSNMEYDISNLMSAQKRLLNNSSLISLSLGKYETAIYQRKLIIDGLQQKLTEINEISRIIENVFVYIPVIRKKISPFTVSELTDEDIERMNNIMDERNAKYPFMVTREGLSLNLAATNTELSTYNNSVALFLISIELSESVLKRELSRIAGNEQSTTMLVGQGFFIGNRTHPNEALDIKISEIVTDSKSEDIVEYLESVKLDDKQYVIIYKRPKMLNVVFANYMPEDYLFYSARIYSMWLLIATVMMVLAFAIISLYLYSMIAKPLNNLIKAFEKTHDGSFRFQVEYNKKDEFYLVYSGFNQMMFKIKQLIESVYEQKIYIQGAQLKELQHRINPHFLYNSMFIIYRLSKSGDCENITKLSNYLSKYYQYITRSPLDYVDFNEEIAYTRHYVEIQMFRFADRISFIFEPTLEICSGLMVPKLIIQPIVENAFVHGLEKRAANGKLIVRQVLENESVLVIVEDNGVPIEDSKMQEIKERLDDQSIEVSGLINVHRRLKIKFGEDSGISIDRGEMGGFKVTLKIPLKDD